jgi:gas vesicle protein
MEIKKSSTPSPSIDQRSSTEKASAPSAAKTTNTGISSNMKDSWQDFVSETAQNGGAVDPNALVQFVLRESYLQTTEDLRFYAEKVKYFNETKKTVRDHLEGLRDADPKLKAELAALQPGQKSNVMEAVTQVIKESAQDNNETKKHYLDLLSSMNKISNSVAEQQQRFVEASTNLTVKKKDDDD